MHNCICLWCSCKKIAQISWLKSIEIYSLTALGSGNLRSQAWQDCITSKVRGKNPFHAFLSQLLVTSDNI